MKNLKLFTLFFSFLFSLSAFATKPIVNSIFDELTFENVVNVTIEVDYEALTADKRNETKHPAIFSYENQNGELQSWAIKTKLRGKFRRMKCNETPPLKLYFDKDALKEAGLAKFDDLKLVNYCEEDLTMAKEALVKEYLAYKMYNQITDESFRVQIIKVTYKDIKTKKKTKRFAFLIEDTAQLRARIGAKKIDTSNGFSVNLFSASQTQTMALFQYMIGNSDWKLEREKNTKIIEKDGQLLSIPYDFDFSGLVSASYASLNGTYNLTSLKDRVYLGKLEGIEATIELFETKKEAIIEVVKDCKMITSVTKKEMIEYINSFYENLNPDTLLNEMPSVENTTITSVKAVEK